MPVAFTSFYGKLPKLDRRLALPSHTITSDDGDRRPPGSTDTERAGIGARRRQRQA
jgi:hypothetical protein